MIRSKKAKRDDRVVTYVRLKPDVHVRLAKIAEKRGLPHTITSVAAEMITAGLEKTASDAAELISKGLEQARNGARP